MKKYEVLVSDEDAVQLNEVLQSLPFVKEIKQTDFIKDSYTIISENSLAEDWLTTEDDELQRLYNK